MNRIVLFVLFALLVPTTAFAEGFDTTLGVRAIGGSAFNEDHATAVGGVGLTAERAFLHHHLELELVGAYIRHDGHNGATGELVLKVPWALSNFVDVYGGAGGIIYHGNDHTLGGYLFDIGSRVWTSDHFGLGLEFDYVTLLGEHGSRGVEAAFDVMYRF